MDDLHLSHNKQICVMQETRSRGNALRQSRKDSCTLKTSWDGSMFPMQRYGLAPGQRNQDPTCLEAPDPSPTGATLVASSAEPSVWPPPLGHSTLVKEPVASGGWLYPLWAYAILLRFSPFSLQFLLLWNTGLKFSSFRNSSIFYPLLQLNKYIKNIIYIYNI